MIRGIHFELPDDICNQALSLIFENIDLSSYKWINYLDQFECYCCRRNCEIDIKEFYNGNELFSIVNDEYILFMKLQAFVNSGNEINCHTYNQFLKSDCEMLILIYDVYYVDIYIKSIDIFNKLKSNALKSGFLDIVVITDENDCRTKLDVISGYLDT